MMNYVIKREPLKQSSNSLWLCFTGYAADSTNEQGMKTIKLILDKTLLKFLLLFNS